MNRRDFLARLGFGSVSAAAAVLTLDIERLLWVPGEKTIVLPPLVDVTRIWPITPQWVVNESVRMWQNQLKFTAIDRRYDMTFQEH